MNLGIAQNYRRLVVGQAKIKQKNDLFDHHLFNLSEYFSLIKNIRKKNWSHRIRFISKICSALTKTIISYQILIFHNKILRKWSNYYRIDIIISKQNHMRSKNMADYTDFTGKTNKKIVQPPGGVSSFSIGWYNDVPERNIPRNSNWDKQSTSTTSHQTKGSFDEPMMLMEEIHDLEFERNIQQNFNQKEEASLRNGAYNRTPTQQNNGSSYRTCVKIHEQKQSVVLGDETYNYWEELRKEKAKQEKSSNRVQNQNQKQQSEIKTGVKVQLPPGGKSNFIFG